MEKHLPRRVFFNGGVFAAFTIMMAAGAFNEIAGQNASTNTQSPALKPKSVAPPPKKSDPSKSLPKQGSNRNGMNQTKKPDNDNSHHVTVDMDEPKSLKHISTGTNFTYKELEENLVITGKKAEYNDKTYVMDLNGNIVLDDDKHHVTGDKAHIDDSQSVKLAVFTGNVVIVVKPKPVAAADASDSAKQRAKGVTLTCDKVEDYYKRDFVILTGHFTAKQLIQEDDGTTVERTMTAEHAEYDGKKNSLHLFAPVDVTDTLKQEAHFDEDVFVGTKEGEESLESKGRSHGKFRKKQDEEKPATAPPPASTPPPPSN